MVIYTYTTVLINIGISFVFVLLIMMSILSSAHAQDTNIDVKCTVYEQGDDVNGNDVDVRVLVMGLKPDNYYTANILPDHNPPKTVTTDSDYEGIFWIIAKIPNGEKSTLFSANVYEGNSTDGQLVASGDDDAPCFGIQSLISNPSIAASASE